MVVVGEAADGPEALRLAHTHTPEVALLDIAMPHLNGLEMARRLRETVPQTKSILLTMHTDEPYIFAALRFWGGRLCREDAGGGGLVQAIHTVVQGAIYVSPWSRPHWCRPLCAGHRCHGTR